MREDKKLLYNHRILNCLLNGTTCTTLEIAGKVGLSEKTVRTRLNELGDWMKRNGFGRIRKKQGSGVWLEFSGDGKRRLERYLDGGALEREAGFRGINRQLIGTLLKLKPGEITTLQQLAESLYISAPTAGRLLREVSCWFEDRGLGIASVRSKGVCLRGNEYSFRMAIRDYMMDMMPEAWEALLGTFAPRIDAARIRRIIVEAENAWRIELADDSFKMVWLMTCLSLARNGAADMEGFCVKGEEIQNYNEYAFAESLYQRIKRVYQTRISQEDVVLLAVLLLGAKKIKNFTGIREEDYTKKYDKDLGEFVRLIISTIGTILDADLSKDEILQESLLLHMRSAVFRMKYSTAAGNNISRYVKEEYKQTFLAAWATSSLFEEFYGVQVTEDELAGIALYIQAALIRRKKDLVLSALLVSHKGLASSQLAMEMIKYHIPEILDIQAAGYHDLCLSQYEGIDLIINMSSFELGDKRAVGIGPRLNDQGIEQIRWKVNEIFHCRKKPEFHFSSLCHPLFEADLLFCHPKASDKDALIAMMVKKLEEKGDVTPNYLASVYERERATATSIGRGIAIPHGNMAEINEPKIAVAILKEPIRWHDDLVDVVFLLAVKMTSSFEARRTKQFYKDFLQLTDEDENLNAMKSRKTALELYQYFIK